RPIRSPTVAPKPATEKRSARTNPGVARTAPRTDARRSWWPKRMRREATFAPGILVRVSEPRPSTPFALKLAVGGLLLVVGWPMLRWDKPAPIALPAAEAPV